MCRMRLLEKRGDGADRQNMMHGKGHLLRLVVLLWVIGQCVVGAGAGDEALQYQILEELPPNTYIADVVEDAKLDMGERRLEELEQLQFSIHDRRGSQRSYKDFFKINARTGILRTAKVIDRDDICPHKMTCPVNLNVMVQPGQFFQIIKITILIMDLNDNGPVFPQSVIVKQIPEASSPGTAFSVPSAEDEDSGVFGVQQYDLVSTSSKFELRITNSSTMGVVDLHLVLRERVDREEKEVYNLELVALDGGTPPKSGSMRVQIQVQDANDNNPRFNNYTYEVSIVENILVDSTIIRLHAKDPDSGPNGEVVYEFSSQTKNEYGDLFAIDADTGEIYIRGTVDYEKGSVYYLTVIAHDRGPNSLPAYAKVVVHVIDINDHSPEITLNALTSSGLAEVSEGAAVGTFVAHVSVVDLDGGVSGEVSCSMNSQNFDLQQLYQTEYKITTINMFDREKQAEYHLNIVCQDHGMPPKTSTKHVTVNVVDSNDNGPVFWRQGYVAELRENNPINAYVTQVNATDRDAGRNSVIRYSIMQGNSRGLLAISANTGVIRATVVFDYERQRQYRFILMARDQGKPPKSSTATLTLNIVDTNDEAPRFAQPTYVYGVIENRPPGTEVGYVRASDPDSDPFSDILYSLDLWKGGFDQFSIDSITGQLTTKSELDREEQDVYNLVVVARNRGYPHMKTSVNVTVFVSDKNDNAPVIDYPHQYNNTVFISNQLAVGSRVVRVKAHDPDYGDSGALTFTIVSGNDKDVFILNTSNGWITVKRSLEDYHSQIHRFVIMVSDHGEPQHSSRTELHVVVNKSVALVQSLNSGFSLFNIKDSHLIIGTAIIVFLIVVLVVAIVAVQCRQRRSGRGSKYNCRREARKRNGTDTPSANGGWTKADLKDKPKKAVTFRMDMDDSDADDADSLWPPNAESEPPPACPLKSKSYYSAEEAEADHLSDDDGSKPGGAAGRPARGAYWAEGSFSQPATAAAAGQHSTASNDRSTYPPLTRAELEMHEMLQLLHQDVDSETGSYTDSGRGPSEEGDNNAHGNTLETHLGPDSKAVSYPSPAEGEARDQGPWQPMLRPAHGNRNTSMKSFLPPAATLRQPRFSSRVHNYDPSSLTMPGGAGRGPNPANTATLGAAAAVAAAAAAPRHPPCSTFQRTTTSLPGQQESEDPSSLATLQNRTCPKTTSTTTTSLASTSGHVATTVNIAAQANTTATNAVHKQLPSTDSKDSCYGSNQSSSDNDGCHGSTSSSHDNLTTTRLALAPKVPRWRTKSSGVSGNLANGAVSSSMCDKLRDPLEEESGDAASDAGTTTSGSFVVDLEEPEIRTHSSKVTDILV